MITNLSTKIQPRIDLYNTPKSHSNRTFDYGLEGLRGLAALWVGYAHVVLFFYQLDPTYHPTENPLFYLHSAHGAVLIFFVLSGYVIGLTNTNSFSFSGVKQYIFRRVIRLVPIYVTAIVLSVMVSPTDSVGTVVSNLFFLQNLASSSLSGNIILWTLNYEVVYYLLFLLIWYFRPNALYLIMGAVSIGIAGWLDPSIPQIISGYAIGWVFWIAGLWLAWRVPQKEQTTRVPLFSYLCLLCAFNHLDIGAILLNGIGLANPDALLINLTDLAFLPICLLLVASITQRFFPAITLLERSAFFLVATGITVLLSMGRLEENMRWEMAALYLLIAVLSSKILVKSSWLSSLAYFGSISYGIYVFHMPIMHLIHDWIPFNGSLLTFWLRAIIWVVSVVALSHCLERYIQPKIKHWSKQLNQ